MNAALLLLIVPSLLLDGCSKDGKVDGWDTQAFASHRASSFRQTPAGHLRDAGPIGSVGGGFLTDAEIDRGIDVGFARFALLFPEFSTPNPRVSLNDDYVMYVTGAGWASGACMGRGSNDVSVCLWSRGTSTIDPGAEYIKRAPNRRRVRGHRSEVQSSDRHGAPNHRTSSLKNSLNRFGVDVGGPRTGGHQSPRQVDMRCAVWGMLPETARLNRRRLWHFNLRS